MGTWGWLGMSSGMAGKVTWSRYTRVSEYRSPMGQKWSEWVVNRKETNRDFLSIFEALLSDGLSIFEALTSFWRQSQPISTVRFQHRLPKQHSGSTWCISRSSCLEKCVRYFILQSQYLEVLLGGFHLLFVRP